MSCDCNEAVALTSSEASPVINLSNASLHKEKIKKYLLNKVLPVMAHILSLLIGLGIIIIMSNFVD